MGRTKMLTVIEGEDFIEIQSKLPTGQRVLFLVFSLIPWIAPYQLIIKPGWMDYFNVFFLIALVISLGAIVVSAFFIWAAIAGLNSLLRFDKRQGILSCSEGAPILKWRTTQCTMDAISSLRIEKHDWSDGSPSYTIQIVIHDGREFKSGSSWSLTEMQDILRRVSLFIGLPVQA